ncbi:MAG TPA: hydroxysqualene dehydroxylase HpnE [Lichenihabitans sp.]|jgi:squalene-associated FAD-dependent desaturase|nr:hydroxysqualene dehydroxylase HpnE [Lichenihabitans sp.]
MTRGTVHVIGAGLAGLAAALALDPARHRIVLHEAARHAGGRCRSYFDQTLGQVIDNGNHLVLSGNTAVREHLSTIGAQDKLAGPAEAAFDFIDLATGERWRLRPNDGPLPWWILAPGRRVPGTRAKDYLALARLMRASPDATVAETMRCEGRLYERLWHPLLVAALNTDPKISSAALAGAVVRETLAKGGAACRPLVAVEGLAEAFVDPALKTLAGRGVEVRFDHRLRGLAFEDTRVAGLDFGDDHVALGPDDAAILAVTAPVAAMLVPGLDAPQAFRAIVNAHFKAEAPAGQPLLVGLVNAASEWVFSFPGRLSVTISDADRFLDTPREELAALIWQEVAAVTKLDPAALPPWRIIKEKRATFAALPQENARRPGPDTRWDNLKLAGDWTRTGLPATIEGALRSGKHAAKRISDKA